MVYIFRVFIMDFFWLCYFQPLLATKIVGSLLNKNCKSVITKSVKVTNNSCCLVIITIEEIHNEVFTECSISYFIVYTHIFCKEDPNERGEIQLDHTCFFGCKIFFVKFFRLCSFLCNLPSA